MTVSPAGGQSILVGTPPGVTLAPEGAFGQSGDLDSVYRYHRIDTDSIVAAALDLVD